MSDDSTKNKQVFEGDKYAEDYRKGRSKHPESLINAVLHFLRLKVQKHALFYNRNSLYTITSLKNKQWEFCYQNCSDLLGEKNVLVIKKHF